MNELNKQGAKIRYKLRFYRQAHKLDKLALNKKGKWSDFERKLYETAIAEISKPLTDEIRCET